MMSFVNKNVRYQPPLNEVLDEVDALKDRIIRMENRYVELETENNRLYRLLDSLDERINILINETS
tara:strand:- start:2250 stop:2447 length:198 start_codon:yes stop_codon:yes gene_type:complete